MAGFVLLLDRDIDAYPPSPARSTKPKREIFIIGIFWGMALMINAIRLELIDPYLSRLAVQPVVRELVYAPVVTLLFLALPLYISFRIDKYQFTDLGLTWKSRSTGVTIFALTFGAISGILAFLSGETVVGITNLSAGALLLLIYNNAFIEEFFYRGVITNRLERVVSQRWAVVVGSIIFSSTHILLDFKVLSSGGGLSSVLYAVIMQFLGGCLLGMIFIKTRSLWPGVVCHYLVNWMPSILILVTSG
jgi:membrane protease YdiL (CAAX protease family)